MPGADDDVAVVVLKLYVTGASRRSLAAVERIQELCQAYLGDGVTLEIIDIYQQPEQARRQNLVAAPTLVRELPPPVRRFVGDMSNTERILAGLGVAPAPEESGDGDQ